MKNILCSLITIACSLLPVRAQIIYTSTIEDAQLYIDQSSWFLVDLDNTLFQARQALGHTEWFDHEMKARMSNGMEKQEAIADFNPHWVEAQKICEVIPVEEKAPEFIARLQEEGIIVMGFTHRPCSVMESTLRQIASIGVDFSKSSITQEELILPAQEDKAMHINGVIFSGAHNPKGEVLDLFFNHTNQRPKKIVFIDDKDYNLSSLEELLAETDIEYVGIHYRGVDNQPKIFHPEIARVQFEWMNKIISNEMALRMIDEESKVTQ